MFGDVEYPEDKKALATVAIPGWRERIQKKVFIQKERVFSFRCKNLAGRVDAIWQHLDVGEHEKSFLQELDEMRNL